MVDRTLKYILKDKTFKSLAAGRTDAMVSANQTAIELFFDIDADKLQEFLADPVVSENINRFNFVPIRYEIEPYNNN
jgi:tRNA U38,U39,U40 pseudouridine synthase TruA